MAVDVAFWVGAQPESDEAAAAEFGRRSADASSQPPAPELTSFVEALLQRWPEHEDADEEEVWGEGPVMDLVRGAFFHTVVLTTATADDALAFMIEESPRYGLVAFDPQSGGLLR